MPADSRYEAIERPGLLENAIAAAAQRSLHHLFVHVNAGEHDDREGWVLAFDEVEQVQATFTAQIYVQDGQVKPAVVQGRLGLRAGRRRRHVETFGVEIERQQLAELGVIINEQNMRFHTTSIKS